MSNNNTTPIFGRLKNVTKEEPYVAGAVDIKDDVKSKNQQTINQETDEHLGEHDTHLETHDVEIADRYTKEEVNNIVSRTPETDVIVIEVPSASQSDIAGWLDVNTPSGTDPETGRSVRANKLYRVPGPDNTTYSEWAWDGTKYIMLANKDYGIDSKPEANSKNLIYSGTAFDNIINKDDGIPLTVVGNSWHKLDKVLRGWVVVKCENVSNGYFMLLPISDSQHDSQVVRFDVNSSNKGILMYLGTEYREYVTSVEGVVIYNINMNDYLGGVFKDDCFVISNWGRGYFDRQGELHTTQDLTWLYKVINVVEGHYYLLPYCHRSDILPLVSLDDEGNFVTPLKYGDQNTGYPGFAIVKAETPKIGITWLASISSIGNSVSLNTLLQLPYIDLSAAKYNPFYKIIPNVLKFTDNFCDIGSYGVAGSVSTGYYNKDGVFVPESPWKTWAISVEAGTWYIVNTCVGKNVRIVDIDDNLEPSINESVPESLYDYYSKAQYGDNNPQWVLVKPKYSTLGLSFFPDNGSPRYAKIDRYNSNNIFSSLIPIYEGINSNTEKVYKDIKRKPVKNAIVKTTEWLSLEEPLSGWVEICNIGNVNGDILFLSPTDSQHDEEVISISLNSVTYGFYYFPHKYTMYFTRTSAEEITGLTVCNIDIDNFVYNGIALNSDNKKVLSGWTRGYRKVDFHATTDNTWFYTEIDVIVGHYYLLPFCGWATQSVSPIVHLDENGNFVSIAEINGENKLKAGYVIVKAISAKIGITWLAAFSNETVLSPDVLLPIPYIDIDETPGADIHKYIKCMLDIEKFFDFTCVNVDNFATGYYNSDGHLVEDEPWKHSIIDVDAGNWYLLKTCLGKNTRIVDIDSNGNTYVNRSVPEGVYKYYSKARYGDNTPQWVLVIPAYNKLGITFFPDFDIIPEYVKIDVDKSNNIFSSLIPLYNTIGSDKKSFVVNKSGGGDYNSLSKCILDNKDISDLTIYLKPGIYDIIEEFKSYYGDTFFDTYSNPDSPDSPSYRIYGLPLGNRIKIIGCQNALVKCDYTGSNSEVSLYFSPFNTFGEGFSLIGLNIEASNVRYAVHDEYRGSISEPYTAEYKSCRIKIDNSMNIAFGGKQCIGGGLGANATIMIKDCVFVTVANGVDAVSYHNSADASAKSYITCTGNYIEGTNGFRFSWFGYSQEITEILLSNNNVGKATIVRAETGPDSPWGPSPYENIEVIEWNNVIRN